MLCIFHDTHTPSRPTEDAHDDLGLRHVMIRCTNKGNVPSGGQGPAWDPDPESRNRSKYIRQTLHLYLETSHLRLNGGIQKAMLQLCHMSYSRLSIWS